MAKPSVLVNWVNLAAASYANRNYQGSLNAIASIIKFGEEEGMKMKPSEFNEIIQLAIRNYECLGKYEDAQKFLEKYKERVVD